MYYDNNFPAWPFKDWQPLSPPRRQRGCCGVGPCCFCHCTCHCRALCIFKFVISFSLLSGVLGILTLFFRLGLVPQVVKFDVTNATLDTFNFTNNYRELKYNLAINFTVRNPYKYVEVYYNAIEGLALYEGQKLSAVEGPSFYQGHKSSKEFGPIIFKGQYAMVLRNEDRGKYAKQTKEGVYEIKIKLYLKVKFRLINFLKTWTCKPIITCHLMVPLQVNSSKKFKRTKCRVNLF